MHSSGTWPVILFGTQSSFGMGTFLALGAQTMILGGAQPQTALVALGLLATHSASVNNDANKKYQFGSGFSVFCQTTQPQRVN